MGLLLTFALSDCIVDYIAKNRKLLHADLGGFDAIDISKNSKRLLPTLSKCSDRKLRMPKVNNKLQDHKGTRVRTTIREQPLSGEVSLILELLLFTMSGTPEPTVAHFELFVWQRDG